MIVWAIVLFFVSLSFGGLAISEMLNYGYWAWTYSMAMLTYITMIVFTLVLMSQKQRKYKFMLFSLSSIISIIFTTIDIFVFRVVQYQLPQPNEDLVVTIINWQDAILLVIANLFICASAFLTIKYYNKYANKEQRITDLEEELARLKK